MVNPSPLKPYLENTTSSSKELTWQHVQQAFLHVLSDYAKGKITFKTLTSIIFDVMTHPVLEKAMLNSGDAFELHALMLDSFEMDEWPQAEVDEQVKEFNDYYRRWNKIRELNLPEWNL